MEKKKIFIILTYTLAGIGGSQLYSSGKTDYLKKNGIFVRYFDKPRIDEYIRVTVGTDAQMERLIKTLEGFL